MAFEILDDNVAIAEELFVRGMGHLGRGETLKALACFEKSFKGHKTSQCQSYLGLSIALERGKFSEGLALCQEALRMESGRSDLYLNLGKVLLKAGRRAEAIETVRKGLRLGYSEDAVKLLEALGIRRKPVFPFLARGHFLNKYTGLFLSRLGISGTSSSK